MRFLDTTGWSGDTIASSANALDGAGGRPSGQFVGWVDPNNDVGSGGWAPVNIDGTVDLEYVYPEGGGVRYVRLDDRGDAFKTLPALANAQIAGQTTRWAKHFYFSASYFGAGNKNGVDATIFAYADDAGNVPIGERTKTFATVSSSDRQQMTGVIDFSDVDTEIRSYRLQVRAAVTSAPTNGPYIGRLEVRPWTASVTLGVTQGHVSIVCKQEFDKVQSYLGGVHLVKQIAVDPHFETKSHISIGFQGVATFASPVRFKLGLRKDALPGTACVYTKRVRAERRRDILFRGHQHAGCERPYGDPISGHRLFG